MKCLEANRKQLEMGKGPGLRKEVAGDSPGGGATQSRGLKTECGKPRRVFGREAILRFQFN